MTNVETIREFDNLILGLIYPMREVQDRVYVHFDQQHKIVAEEYHSGMESISNPENMVKEFGELLVDLSTKNETMIELKDLRSKSKKLGSDCLKYCELYSELEDSNNPSSTSFQFEQLYDSIFETIDKLVVILTVELPGSIRPYQNN